MSAVRELAQELPFRLEWPKGSGITIKTVPNRHGGRDFGHSLQVVVPSRVTDKPTLRKQFSDLTDAKAFAADVFKGAARMGTDFFNSSAEDRAAFAAILPELRRRGISLKEALKVGVNQAVTVRRTLDEVIAELLELKRTRWEAGDLRDRSWSDLTHRMGRIALHFQGKQVSEVTEHHIKAWATGLKLARRSTKNFINTVSEVFSFAVQRRYLATSPLTYLGREDRRAIYGVAPEDHSIAIFTPAEAEKLLRAAEKGMPQLIPSLALGLFAGIRSSEIMQLKWSDLTLDGPTPQVCISGEIAKKRKLRFTPLNSTALAWLRKGAGTGLVAPLKFYRKLKRLSTLAEVPWRGNAMRHGFASHYYALTGDAIKVSAALGHRSGDTVLFDHYRQLVTSKDAAAYFAIMPNK